MRVKAYRPIFLGNTNQLPIEIAANGLAKKIRCPNWRLSGFNGT